MIDTHNPAIINEGLLRGQYGNGGGGSGTNVIANPEGAASDELEKLQVGASIYSIPAGGLNEEVITYTGTGNATNEVTLTHTPKYICGYGVGSDNADLSIPLTPIEAKTVGVFYANGVLHSSMSYNDETKKLTLISGGIDAGWCLNALDKSNTLKFIY